MLTRGRLADLTQQNPRILVREPYHHDQFYRSSEFLATKYLIYGASTTYIPSQSRKLIDVSVWPYTSGELARTYLKLLAELQDYRSGMRKYFVPWRKADLTNYRLTAPLFFQGGIIEGEWVYVDLCRAHWQIFRPCGYDVKFTPGVGGRLVQGRLHFLDASFLGSEKGIYRAVSGHTQWKSGRAVSTFAYGDPVKNLYNYYLAPGLWGIIAATLHAIAHDAVYRFGAVYVNHDGYIFPARKAEAFRDYLATTWGLESSIKGRGRGEVSGLRNYRVGDLKTRRPGGGRPKLDGIITLDGLTRNRLLEVRKWPTY